MTEQTNPTPDDPAPLDPAATAGPVEGPALLELKVEASDLDRATILKRCRALGFVSRRAGGLDDLTNDGFNREKISPADWHDAPLKRVKFAREIEINAAGLRGELTIAGVALFEDARSRRPLAIIEFSVPLMVAPGSRHALPAGAIVL